MGGGSILPWAPVSLWNATMKPEHDPGFPAPVGGWRGCGLLVLARPGHSVGDGAGCAPGFSSRSQFLLRAGSGAPACAPGKVTARGRRRGADRGCRAALLRGFARLAIVPLGLTGLDCGAGGRSGLLVRLVSAPNGIRHSVPAVHRGGGFAACAATLLCESESEASSGGPGATDVVPNRALRHVERAPRERYRLRLLARTERVGNRHAVLRASAAGGGSVRLVPESGAASSRNFGMGEDHGPRGGDFLRDPVGAGAGGGIFLPRPAPAVGDRVAEERVGRPGADVAALRRGPSVVPRLSQLAAGGSRGGCRTVLRTSIPPSQEHSRFDGDARANGYHLADVFLLSG